MWAAIIQGVITLAAAYMQKKANERAMKLMMEAEQRNRDIQEAKNAIATARLERQRKETAAGVANLRKISARDPGQMTQGQDLAIEEGRRDTLRAISPGLRGSGRTTTAAIRNVEAGTRGRFIDANRARQDRASSLLFGAGNVALRDMNAIDTGMGNIMGESYRRGGEIQAGEQIDRGKIGQDTLGAMGRIFADYGKDNSWRQEQQQKKTDDGYEIKEVA